MAIALAQSAVGDIGTGSITKAYASDVTAGNILVIAVFRLSEYEDSWAVGDISKSAGTATLGTFQLDESQTFQTGGFYYRDTAIFSAKVTGTGSCTIAVTGGSGSPLDYGICLFEFSGVDQTTWKEDSDIGNGTSTAPLTATVTSAAGAVFVGVASIYSVHDLTITPDANFSTGFEYETGTTQNGCGSAIYRIVTSGTTDAAEWSISLEKSWSACVAVYKEAAPEGGEPGDIWSTITL
jgi:hypothetical protein